MERVGRATWPAKPRGQRSSAAGATEIQWSVVSLDDRAQLYGTLTAMRRTVNLDEHSIVYGAVTARKILVTDAAQIIPPSIVSPQLGCHRLEVVARERHS